jgi:UDP-N-acetylglucosamine 3-dehydrogenase
MSKMRKTCFIAGAGFMGLTHAQGYMKGNNKVEIAGIIDSDIDRARKLAEPYGAQAFESLEDAFSYTKVDFLDVCLPSPLHASYATKAMEHGSDVIVEKPFSITLEDADLMLQMAKKTKQRLFVAHVCRFMPQYVRAKELYDAGIIGSAISLHCSRLSPRPAWGHNNWFFDKKLSGGTLLDLSIHDIDLAHWFLGTPTEYGAILHEHKELAGIAHVTSSIRYENNSNATVVASHLMPDGYNLSSEFLLLGTKGYIEFSSKVDAESLFVYTDKKMKRISLLEVDPFALADPYAAELNHFVDCLITGKEFSFTADDARLALETVHKLYDIANSIEV